LPCCLALFRLLLHWTGQRSFTSPTGAFVYLVLPALFAIALFAALRLAESQRLNLALCLFSIALTVYIVEAATTLWFSLPSVIHQNHQNINQAAAKALGVRYDDRTRAEVIDDFRKRGIDAVPSLSPHELLKEQNDGTMKSATTAVNGTELLPLASMAGKLTVVCNEGGEYLTYTSDRTGLAIHRLFGTLPLILSPWETPLPRAGVWVPAIILSL
jgi:hypothetical protein